MAIVSGDKLDGVNELDGVLELHHLLPEEKQGAMVRLDGILDELLKVHDYPEDVLEVAEAKMGEWCRRWHERGVRRGSTLAEFEFSRVPKGVIADMEAVQQSMAHHRDTGGEMLPPGKKAS